MGRKTRRANDVTKVGQSSRTKLRKGTRQGWDESTQKRETKEKAAIEQEDGEMDTFTAKATLSVRSS